MEKRPGIFSYITFIIILFMHTSSVAQVLNLSQTDILTGAELGLVDTTDRITDVWGYYDAVTQKEYAIVGMGDKGTQLVDVTEPYNIFPVSDISTWWPIPSLNSTHVKTYGHYLYIANNSEDNILIKNISDPTNPTGTTFIEVDTLGVPNKPANAHNLYISDAGKLFVMAISGGIPTENHRVWIYDLVGNETQPVLIRSWSGPDLGLDTTSAGLYYFPHDLYVKGNTAYIAWSGTGVVVVDFNPTTYDPITIRIHQYDSSRPIHEIEFRTSHGIWLSDDSDHLYVTDEWGDFGNMRGASILRIFDISNINSTPYPLVQFYDVLEESVTGQIGSNISQIVDVPSGDSNNSIHNILVKEPFAYISYYTKGVRVLDVSDPTKIIEVAYFDVLAAGVLNDPDTYSDGTWGIYPFAPSGYIYASGHDELNSLHDDLRIFKQDFIKSGNITANETWSDYAYVAGNVTVNQSVTLTIDPGTLVKFASGAKLSVNGTLIAQGTSADHITFTRMGTSGSWYGIRFENSSVDAACIIKYADIEYASFGVDVYYANPKIENSTFKNNTRGMYFTYSSPSVKTNEISQSSQDGIYMFGSDPYLYDNYIHNNSADGINGQFDSSPSLFKNSIKSNSSDGYYAFYYSSPEFGPTTGYTHGDNIVSNNGANGLYVYYHGDPFLGGGTPWSGFAGGYNSIANNTSYNVKAQSNSDVIARNNWWGASPPPSSKFYADGTSSIDRSFHLSSASASGNSLGKSAGIAPLDTNSVASLYEWGKEFLLTDKRNESIGLFKMLIRKFPDTPEARLGVVKIAHLHRKAEMKGLDAYLSKIIKKDNDDDLVGVALDLLSSTYMKERDFDSAVSTNESILTRSPDTGSEYIALFNLFTVYRNELKDDSRAGEFLSILKAKYPDHELTLFAQSEMGEDVDWSLAKKAVPENISQAESISNPKEYNLGANYPNPFNPETQIDFSLPEDGLTKLIIYDLLGREVSRLVDDDLKAGYHNVTWNASNVASGLYFYRLTSGDFVSTKKMVLLK